MLSSTASAAENVGNRLGEYVEAGVHEGRPYYKQRDTLGNEHFLYHREIGSYEWGVSETLGGEYDGVYNNQNTRLPPTTGWRYWDGEKRNSNDTSLTLSFTSLSPCQLVRVAGEGEVVGGVVRRKQLGDYRFALIILLDMKYLKSSSQPPNIQRTH